MSDDSVCCLVDCVVGVVGKGEVVLAFLCLGFGGIGVSPFFNSLD